ncbi:MAG: exodeoxyribonuclease VII small subunit [Saccharospirillaceae bacterium]|nr:exodeoxyribonuclease VII small subunit [Thalassolituus sp. HI0120]MCH2042363.1 exodeoxyribonuclease VII small subunit [Saccharospirillaceae bacterium]
MTEQTPENPDNFEFETALQQLEQLVKSMESGELSLQDSLQAFEQGVRLTRQCQQALSSAEQRVQILMEQNGQSQAYPFNGGEQ